MSSHSNTVDSRVSFVLVDVFTDTPLTGNPLAVVPDADALDDETMRRLAREFNQPETTFVLAPTQRRADAGRVANWRLRSFSANGTEVGGAGHNALGAWWWLAESGRLALTDPRTTFTQEIGGRLLPVVVVMRDGRIAAIEMTQEPPTFGRTLHGASVDALAAALRLSAEEIGGPLVPQVVSTGAAHLLVPVVSRQAVERAAPDADRLLAVLREADAEGCYLFARDPIDSRATAHARFFNPTIGLAEDIATGTAAGPLACYLTAHRLVAEGTPVIIEQGHALHRPSRLEIVVRGADVRLAGRGCISTEGTVRTPAIADR